MWVLGLARSGGVTTAAVSSRLPFVYPPPLPLTPNSHLTQTPFNIPQQSPPTHRGRHQEELLPDRPRPPAVRGGAARPTSPDLPDRDPPASHAPGRRPPPRGGPPAAGRRGGRSGQRRRRRRRGSGGGGDRAAAVPGQRQLLRASGWEGAFGGWGGGVRFSHLERTINDGCDCCLLHVDHAAFYK